MAKVISLIGTLSGKVGGMVYSRNRWGQYIRQLVMPTQPRTSFQVSQRGRIADMAAAWRLLTATQRLQWASFATQIVRSDTLGIPLQYNGYTAFMLVNASRSYVAQPMLDVPPEMWSGYQPDLLVFSVVASAMSLHTLARRGLVWVSTGTHRLVAWSCPWQSPGAHYPRTWRAFFVSGPDASFPMVLTAAYAARFGAITPSANRRYFLAATLVNIEDPPVTPSKTYVSARVSSSVISLVS